MLVKPLTVTSINWSALTEMWQNVMGEAPTRSLDSCGINIKDPAAFLAAIDLDDNPLENLRDGKRRNTTFCHYFLGFILVLDASDEDLLPMLTNQTRLSIIWRVNKKKILCMLSGSMDMWMDAICVGCSRNADITFRKAMNEIVKVIDTTGLKKVLDSYPRADLPDGTFIFKDK